MMSKTFVLNLISNLLLSSPFFFQIKCFYPSSESVIKYHGHKLVMSSASDKEHLDIMDNDETAIENLLVIP